jgi:DNA-binding SARP family transcriptional activator
VADRRGTQGNHRIFDVVGAVLAALLAFTAVPAVLVLVVGNPLSAGLGHGWSPAPRDTLFALTLAAWVAWVACCAQLIRAVISYVRHGGPDPLGSASILDRLAARIAVGVLAISTVGAPVALSSVAEAAAASIHPASSVALPGARQSGSMAHVTHATRATRTTQTHVVRLGETLPSIATQRLDDAADWTTIASLNLGRDMGHGTRFIDPDQVRAGWRLLLPPEARPAESLELRSRGESPSPAHPRPSDRLPELVALGLGSLACAALARRSRRRLRPPPFSGELDLPGTLSEPAVDAASLLHRFERLPALESFEAANRLLGRSLRGTGTCPSIRAVCVSPSGVTFWMAGEPLEAPDGFTSVTGSAAWHVDHDALEGQPPFDPYVPIAIPVGDDDEGTWLITLDRGTVLPVLGESAPALVRSAWPALEAWAWSDAVFVTEDPDDPTLHSLLPADRPDAHPPSVVFFGDPLRLAPAVLRHVAVVTTSAVGATDLTVLVDRRRATLHPMGRVVRPFLQSPEAADAIAEVVGASFGRRPDTTSHFERSSSLQNELAAPRPHARPARPAALAAVPGVIDVRLLTPAPRLDGLREELPPNRARRAVELVAYLALHQPDVITSDRLRTRVLGSTDADAAAKTLFNTAYAARRAMGANDNGVPLFPAATRNGHYQVSPLVTVDVHRAVAFVDEAKSNDDPRLAIAHFRAALELVEGEPLATTLAGYSWWEAEGHGGRIAAVLVDAARSLSALAGEAGLFDLARWGLERALLVEPYSEALSRAAMELAAAEGDADRLRFEWRECQRRVDALDPGSSPSSRTESLYGELSRRVLVGVSNAGPGRPVDPRSAGD